MKFIKIAIAYIVLFPIIGISLESFGLEHPAWFAYYGAVFALIYNFAEQESSK